jgi:cytochrome P450
MTILYLINNPVAYRRFQKEIDEAYADGRASSPIKDSEARNIPYIQAVMREGFRMIPPVISGFFYKVVPKEGDKICGHFVPGGTKIATGAALPAMVRSKEIWGEDADAFRPERWLEADQDRLQAMIKVLDFGFGNGQFQCLGKPLALMTITKTVVEVFFPLKQNCHRTTTVSY